MRRFVLRRRVDVSGVSGTGVVAEGVEFADGRVATRWLAPPGRPAQTCVWDCVADVLAVHGHGGLTDLEWIDPPTTHADPTPTTLYGLPMLGAQPGPPPRAA